MQKPQVLFVLLVLATHLQQNVVVAFSITKIHHSSREVGKLMENYGESPFQSRGRTTNTLSMDTILNSSSNSNRAKTTELYAKTPTGSIDKKEGPFLNFALVRQLLFNQLLVGYTIWNGGSGAIVLARDCSLDAIPFALGILGVLPLIFLSQNVEKSESPLVASLNLSTDSTMLRLFGSKPQPAIALPVSATLAILTGLVEEVTFRGQVLPVLSQWSIDHLDVVGTTAIFSGTVLSTLIFAALHVNPLGLINGLTSGMAKDAATDALVLFAFQCCTGSIFAILFLASGYNLAVPIVAHALYDFYTFYNTHLEVTKQFEYVENESLKMPLGNNSIETKWIEKKGEDFVKEARQMFYLMDKNKDGVVSRKELRVASYSYGVNLSKMESETALLAADSDESGAIDFNEFLEFIEGGSTGKAVKRALLGVI